MLAFLAVFAVAWLLVVAALMVGVHWIYDRRQLSQLAARLRTESRIDDLTRASVQAMRDAVRQAQR